MPKEQERAEAIAETDEGEGTVDPQASVLGTLAAEASGLSVSTGGSDELEESNGGG